MVFPLDAEGRRGMGGSLASAFCPGREKITLGKVNSVMEY